MKKDCFVIGIDYGTDSVRSVIINAYTGQEIASSVFPYPRWRDGLYCDAGKQQFGHRPEDHEIARHTAGEHYIVELLLTIPLNRSVFDSHRVPDSLLC